MPKIVENNTLAPDYPLALPNPETTSLQTIELFLGMFAHELRSQVAGTVQVCRYIREGKNKDIYLRALDRATLDTLLVLDNMLTTVKIRAGKLDITTVNESFQFKAWIHPLIRSFDDAAAIQRKDINLTLYPSLEEAFITTDKVKLGQIIQNLLTNALKFSYPNTCIAVKCHILLAGLTIQVINQGMGIPPGKAATLFDPYEQLDKGLAGSGLGLYLSRLYSQALGGSLTVKSNHGNTVFTLTIPVYR
ncbi:HAMP domain-containing sensor histidine kinase [Chitinophaga sp. LS1]|uniref:sensor histidine kinase n=1 Tax=Chitinophaga sp. LS1 TaxID=3051176 RepID=UPI002AAB366B|nr:HAMP domain-containing sensor histidine kinase [Chitinophaga sp. LS1]WPV65419.1 HAMP domain-containing sensor histidine kinase [Chitinophaga sp. LS1]